MTATLEHDPPIDEPRAAQHVPGARLRVLLTTEGTYPYVVGGVSSWCDLLVNSLTEFDWLVLPIIGAHGQPRRFALPPHASAHGPIEIWSERLAQGGRRAAVPGGRTHHALPALLVRDLIGWNGDTDALLASLVWCRQHPAGVRRAFRSGRGWDGFLAALGEVLQERECDAGTPPALDQLEAAQLYQTLYWVARTAAAPAPEADVIHVTAAGWSAIPAVVNKALHGTPMILTEHGVYVRESYLAAIRNGGSAGSRFAATRLARGLARCAYDWADVVAPRDGRERVLGDGFRRRPGQDPRALQRPRPRGDARAAARRRARRLSRPHRSAQGCPHDAARRGRGAQVDAARASSCTTAR